MNKGILSELRKIRAKSINEITGTERIVTIHGFIIILIHSFFAIKYEMIMARTKAETSPAAILKHVYAIDNRKSGFPGILINVFIKSVMEGTIC